MNVKICEQKCQVMKVSKECPYYIEHQLSDWNENECKNM